MDLRDKLKQDKITDNLSHTYYKNIDETELYLVVQMVKPKVSIEKSIRNQVDAMEMLENISQKLNTEEKVLKYLGIK